MTSRIDGVARRLSDPKVIVFSPYSLGVIVFLVLVSWLFVGLRLNQSSIGVWDGFYGAPGAKSVEIGTPKSIRSDEWNTLTPWILSQVSHDFSPTNENVGGGWSAGLMGTPLSDATSLAQPKFWGFHWLPLEFGFSWSWAWKAFAMAIALFMLLLALGQSATKIAFIGALWIYGSSFTQWWFSNGLPEMICAWALAILGALYLLRARTRAGIAFGGLLAAFSVCNMVTYPYPAFQFPLMMLAVTVLIAVTAEKDGVALLREQLGTRIITSALVIAVIGVFAWHFASVAMPTVRAVLETEYPGHRTSVGGDMPWFRVFDGFFEGFRRGEQKYPFPPSNASEASSYVLMFPFIVFVVPWRSFLCRDQLLVSALLAYCVFVFSWMALPLPHFMGQVIAASGWTMSPPIRSALGLGLGSIVLSMVVAARISRGELPVYKHANVSILFVCLAVLGYGMYVRRLDPAFFHLGKIAAGTLAATFITWGTVSRRAWPLALGVLVFVWQPLQVNPVLQGLAPVLQRPILMDARRATDHAGDKWMVVGAPVFSQGLKAQGLDVLTGSEYYPDTRTVKALDPDSTFRSVWNRYAHIVVESGPGTGSPKFKLVQADLYIVTLDVCGDARKRWGATLVAYTGPVPHEDRKCLAPLPSEPTSGVSLFRFRS